MAASPTEADDDEQTDDSVTITISDSSASDLEHAIKDRMVMKLRWAVNEEGGDYWERQYRELAQTLRQLLEERETNTWVTVWEMKLLDDEQEERA